jgi:hypothetical protein
MATPKKLDLQAPSSQLQPQTSKCSTAFKQIALRITHMEEGHGSLATQSIAQT